MPISLASNATAPRILSARRPSVMSASGSPAPVKVILQEDLRGDAVAGELALALPGAGLAQRLVRRVRREAFVAEFDRKREAALELPCEAARAFRHCMGDAVSMHGQSDDQQTGAPFLDERSDGAHRFV